MRIGTSLVLIAIGAILKFAITWSTSGINLSNVGVILMVVGLVGLVISLVLASTARRSDVTAQRTSVQTTVRDDNVEPPRGDDPRL
jgi:hypothetical protein